MLVRGVVVQSSLASGAEESGLADDALNVERLLVDLELRLSSTASSLCVALALLRSLGTVTATHFDVRVVWRGEEDVECRIVGRRRAR